MYLLLPISTTARSLLQHTFSLYEDRGKNISFSVSQTADGCCASAENEGDNIVNLTPYLKRDAAFKKALVVNAQLGKSLLSVTGNELSGIIGQ